MEASLVREPLFHNNRFSVATVGKDTGGRRFLTGGMTREACLVAGLDAFGTAFVPVENPVDDVESPWIT